MLRFVLASLAALMILLGGGVYALQRVGESEATRHARDIAALAGQGVVEPGLTPALLDGDRAALARFDALVQERVLSDRVAHVRVWLPDGRIVYADEPRLVGTVQTLGQEEREVLETGAVSAEISDLSRPENRYEQGEGKLLEVYLPLRAPDGRQVLFETYQRFSTISAGGRRVWLAFAPVVLGALLLLWMVQLPLAWRLAGRVRRGQEERAALLERAVEASDAERRRIAADLHDGVVQDLAGLTFSLEGTAGRAEPQTAQAVRAAAATSRESMRRLRALVVDIHPPNLRTAGLEAALRDLVEPLSGRGIATRLEVGPHDLGQEAERLVFRAAREALRNVEAHAGARRVSVSVREADGQARLTVQDDGAGISPEKRRRREDEGHMGLALLEALAAERGGRLDVGPRPEGGTLLELVVPAR